MSGARVAIRAYTMADYDQWLPLWQAYQTFYEAALPDEVTQTTWRRILDPGEPMFGALAFAGEQAVGMVQWIYHRSNWSVGDYCYLQDLFVSEDSRKLGAGRALIEHVYEEAAAAKCSRVYWLTHETNHTAMRLYDRVAAQTGFVQYRKML